MSYNLFFDVETTGLPKNYKKPYTDLANWPHIVQLSWIVASLDGTVIKEVDRIIKVDFPIPEQASRVHGITNEISLQKGVPLKDVLEEFLSDLPEAVKLIGHNLSFDFTILQSELLRCNLNPEIQKNQFCTMKSSTDYCRLPGPYGFKWPKLEEVYQICFNEVLENAHNALIDVRATARVYYELKKRAVFS